MEWNKDNTRYFIDLIKQRPVIWDVCSSKHKNKNEKKDAIKEISFILGITGKEVLIKWSSLRGQYYREKKKVTRLKTGSGAEEIYISKWFAYQEMSNMLSYNIPQKSFCNFEDNLIPSPQSMSSSPPPATPTPPAPPAMPTTPLALPPPSKLPNKKRNRNTAIYSEAMTTLRASKERRPSSSDLNDDITSFALYIAAQLRKFKPIQQSKLKLDIQTLFYNCEIENLDRRSNSGMSDYSDDFCSVNPDSPMTTNLNDTESNTSVYAQSDMQEVQSMQPSVQIAEQIKPMQSSPKDNAMSTYYPKNKIIHISKDKLIRESKPSQVIRNSIGLPAVIILDKKKHSSASYKKNTTRSGLA